MGYMTDYDYSMNKKEIVEAIDDSLTCGSSGTGELFDRKWYSHMEDLKALSLNFPGELITLEGVGEDFPDIWKAFFKDGKSYVEQAEIVMPKFVPLKLS